MLRIYLFGAPQFERAGELIAVARRKAVALLAYLTVSGQPQRREGLATLLWPDYDQTKARANLRRTLSRLKQAFGEDLLQVDHTQVTLAEDAPVWLDVAAFKHYLSEVAQHVHDDPSLCAHCADLLAEAVALYRGEFLAGFALPDSAAFDEWQFFQGEGLRQLLAGALQQLIDWHVAHGAFDQGIAYGRQWLALDSLHEPAQRRLMQLYAWSGQQAAALRQYQECVRLLQDELAVTPEEETITLYHAIRRRTLAAPETMNMSGTSAADGTGAAHNARASEQQIRYCRTSDGVRIAYATVGQGPVLVKAANWLSHLAYDWNSPVWRHWLSALSQNHMLVRHDQRGCGLSDWDVDELSIDAYVRDLEAVVETLGLERFPILALSAGGAVAIAYAVRHPEKVSRLILCGSYAAGRYHRTYTKEEAEKAKLLLQLIKVGWGKDNPAFRQFFTSLFIPEGTAEQMQWFNELQRVSTSPEVAFQLEEAFFNINIRELVPRVTVPTLIFHSRNDAVVPFWEGQELAATMPNARFVPLESKNHILLEHEPAWQRLLDETFQFLHVETGEVRP